MLFGGHAVTLVCLPAEVEAFNRDGARIKMPIRGRQGHVEIESRALPGKLSAAGPGATPGPAPGPEPGAAAGAQSLPGEDRSS